MGVSRQSAYDVLCLLKLVPEAQETLLKFGDPLQDPIITVNNLKNIAGGPRGGRNRRSEYCLPSKELDWT